MIDYLFFSKEYCLICGEEKANSRICNSCMERFEFVNGRKHLETGVCYYPLFYNNFSKGIIKAFKYEQKTHLVKPIGEILANKISQISEKFDLITYIPMYPLDEFSRGYNQSYLIAKEISKLTKIPLIHLVTKDKKTLHQNKIDIKKRRNNLSGSFSIVKDHNIYDKHILIVDDLVTTGSTFEVISNEILKYYKVKVTFLAFASSKIDMDY